MSKEYEILKVSSYWSTKTLRENAQALMNQKSEEGWEIVSVTFGITSWLEFAMYITVAKDGK